MTGPRVGIDYRPALVNREGIGRYTRELVRAAVELGLGPRLRLFATTLAPGRYSDAELGLAGTAVGRLRLRLPSRILGPLMSATGRGVDDWLGGVEVYHHTQPNLLPVRRAAEVATLFDCLYLDPRGFVDAASSARMEQASRAQVGRARRILVPSRYVAREVVERLGADPERVVVAELGCDHVLRAAPDVAGNPGPGPLGPRGAPYLLTVCRVDARKNHARMLEAFELLFRSGRPEHWIVAGPRGHGFEEFAAALERSPARDRVQWREFVPEHELGALYLGASAFVFASLGEGFGLPPLEAMALGVPAVVGDVTSLPELCLDAAVRVDPLNPEAIARGIETALGDPGLGERGRARASCFTWKECARKTFAAYDALLGEAGPGRG